MTKEENRIRDKVCKERLQKAVKLRIDQLCKEKGVTYYNLAFRASVPMSTLSNVLKGNSKNPGIYSIMKVCDGLGVSLNEFFDDKVFEDAMIESRDEK